MIRLYAYADSSDLYELEEQLVTAFLQFADGWEVQGVLFTNKQSPLVDGHADWNIGLRVQTPELRRSDLDHLLSFLAELSREVNLKFVVGTWNQASRTQDLCFVDRHVPNGAAGEILKAISNAP